MRLIDTKWLIYGESPVPWWVLVAVMIAVIILSIGWMRRELKRATIPARLMPYTLTILLALVSWLVYRPVLIRIQTFEHDGQRIAYLDASDSMNEAFAAPGDKTASLDLLSIYEPAAVANRAVGPRQLHAGLVWLIETGSKQRQALENIQEQLSQGVPVGESAQQVVQDYKTWATKAKARMRTLLASAQLSADAIPKEQAGAAADSVQQMMALTKQVELLRDDVGDLSTVSVTTTILPLDDLLQRADSATSGVLKLQTVVDAVFLAKNEAVLKPKLANRITITRSQAARDLLRQLHISDDEVSQNESHKDQTDIYGDLRDLLRLHENDVISSLLVLSDGGHNGGNAAADVVDDIKKANIDTTCVGVGSLSIGGADLAILDWDVRRQVTARKEFTLGTLIKSPLGVKMPFKLSLTTDTGELVSQDFTTSGRASEIFTLRAKAPDPGRHIVRLTIIADDLSKRNNEVSFILDCVEGVPQVIMLGGYPDWDTSYLTMAAQRNGLMLRQAFVNDAPRRGEGNDAIPNSTTGWSKYRAVILKGSPFKNFTDADADDLYKFVTESGGSMLVLVDNRSYFDPLAKKFNWTTRPELQTDSSLRVAPGAMHLPIARLGVDGPQSGQIFADFAPVEQAYSVPAQQMAVLLNGQGQPVLSLGFYGKGKVYLLGLKGMYRIREFDQGPVADRFFRQLMADVALPMVPTGAAPSPIAWYPELPIAGRENMLISFQGVQAMNVGDPPRKLAMLKGGGVTYGKFTPVGAGVLQVQSTDGGASKPIGSLTAARNPGMEELFDEFNEPFMKNLAQSTGGRYVTLAEAGNVLGKAKPITWRESTADRFPLADHWILIFAMIVVATVHWVLRKLAGLAI